MGAYALIELAFFVSSFSLFICSPPSAKPENSAESETLRKTKPNVFKSFYSIMHLNGELEVLAVAASDAGGNENRYGSEEDFDRACSTPFVSAPSSPTRGGGGPSGYFFSAPASPVHYVLSSSYREKKKESGAGEGLTDFEFTSRCGMIEGGAMSSADELFLDGKIRPMKLSSHLQRPQVLTPLLDLDEEDGGDAQLEEGEEETVVMMRGRDLRMRNRSLRRKTRSLSPLRNSHLDEVQVDVGSAEKPIGVEVDEYEPTEEAEVEVESAGMTLSSRSSSSGSRNSKKWIFVKDLLYRSKSEGRASTKEKFWPSISFSPAKDKKPSTSLINSATKSDEKRSKNAPTPSQHQHSGVNNNRRSANGSVSMRRVPVPSAHELHYTANRAQTEEMKKKTYLPYRQGLFGCLGFSSKGYGALYGFTKTLNPVSSR